MSRPVGEGSVVHMLSERWLTRRAFLRTATLAAGGALASSAMPAARWTARAQVASVSPAFSDTVLKTFRLPEIKLSQQGQGFDAPSSVAAGRYLIALNSAKDMAAYLDLVQMPSGLSIEEAGKQLLSAASNDTPVAGWTYGGGTYALDGGTAWVVLDLTPGEWTWGLTSQSTQHGAAEIPHLMPLTVTGGSPMATPVPSGASGIQPTVDIAMTEMEFQGLGGATFQAWPAVWRFRNVGQQPHHMVLYRTPKLVTPGDIKQLLSAFMNATPTPPPPWWTEAVWAGYTAILSPGHEVFTEFTLMPGSYLALCFIVDPKTHLPHLAEGMAQSFSVALAARRRGRRR